VLGLTLTDIDLDRQTVLVRESKNGQTQKAPVPQTAQAVEDYLALRRSLLKVPDLGVLFLSQFRKPWGRSSVYGWLDDLPPEKLTPG